MQYHYHRITFNWNEYRSHIWFENDLRNGDCVQDTLERAGNLNKNSNSLYQLKEGGAETNEKKPLLFSEHSP